MEYSLKIKTGLPFGNPSKTPESVQRREIINVKRVFQVCGYNRKYATWILNLCTKEPKKNTCPKPIYNSAVIVRLMRLWRASDQMRSKRLVKVRDSGTLPFFRKAKLNHLYNKKVLIRPFRSHINFYQFTCKVTYTVRE